MPGSLPVPSSDPLIFPAPFPCSRVQRYWDVAARPLWVPFGKHMHTPGTAVQSGTGFAAPHPWALGMIHLLSLLKAEMTASLMTASVNISTLIPLGSWMHFVLCLPLQAPASCKKTKNPQLHPAFVDSQDSSYRCSLKQRSPCVPATKPSKWDR